LLSIVKELTTMWGIVTPPSSRTSQRIVHVLSDSVTLKMEIFWSFRNVAYYLSINRASHLTKNQTFTQRW